MRDSRNVGVPVAPTRRVDLIGRMAEGEIGRELAARDDSPALGFNSAMFCGRLAVRGRLSFRSGSLGVSRGEVVGDLRFLRLRASSSRSSSVARAFSNAFHALISSCDSGAGRLRAGCRIMAAVFRKRVAAP
jgi:hypothetical protein